MPDALFTGTDTPVLRFHPGIFGTTWYDLEPEILSRNEPIDSNRDPSCVIKLIPSASTLFALACCTVLHNYN